MNRIGLERRGTTAMYNVEENVGVLFGSDGFRLHFHSHQLTAQ